MTFFRGKWGFASSSSTIILLIIPFFVISAIILVVPSAILHIATNFILWVLEKGGSPWTGIMCLEVFTSCTLSTLNPKP